MINNSDVIRYGHALSEYSAFDRGQQIKVRNIFYKDKIYFVIQINGTIKDCFPITYSSKDEFIYYLKEEIESAIKNNMEVIRERVIKRKVNQYEDNFCCHCDGKISALYGILRFIEEGKPKKTIFDEIREDLAICKNCKHFMFSDCYGECRKAYKGIVNPDDTCKHFERREQTK